MADTIRIFLSVDLRNILFKRMESKYCGNPGHQTNLKQRFLVG